MNRFLYFSRGQQVAIIVLLVLIVVAFVVNWTLPRLLPSVENETDTIYQNQVKAFEQSLRDKPAPSWQSPFEAKPRYEERHLAKNLFDFNPNTLDSADFVRLGFKDRQIGRIMNYRRSGKEFFTADFFVKFCYFSDDDATRLLSYVQIPKKEKQQIAKSDSVVRQPQKEYVHIELNSVDTAELMRLPGIGAGRANQIVSYRKRLGGYVSPDQLLEINNFPLDLYEKLKPYLSVDASKVKKIVVNRARADRLKNHAYISKFQAMAIEKLRNSKPNRQLNSIDDLRDLPEFTDADLRRLEPYLDFNVVKYEHKR